MKKTLLSLLLIIPLCSYGNSKKETIFFAPQYLPETTYDQITEETTETSTLYSGPEETLKLLQERNTENPSKTTEQRIILSQIKTGKISTDNVFPVLMNIITTTSNTGESAILPDGLLLYGECRPGEMLTLDSVATDDFDENQKEIMLELMQNVFQQLSVGKATLKVGESFVQRTPMSIPLMGLVNIDMEIVTTYKLESIKNGLAYFAIKQESIADLAMLNKNFEMGGKGKGTMVYNIEKKIYTEYQLSNEMTTKVQINNITIDLIIKNNYKQLIKTSRNNDEINYSSANKKIVSSEEIAAIEKMLTGKWIEEKKDAGDKTILIFNKNNTVGIGTVDGEIVDNEVLKDKGLGMKYKIDASKNPMWLDIIVYETSTNRKIERIPFSIVFTDNDTITCCLNAKRASDDCIVLKRDK